MAVARVQSDWDVQAASSTTMAYTATGITLSAGNLVEGLVRWNGVAQSVSSIVDNKGNTYGIVDDVQSTSSRGVSFYKANISGGADPIFTITFSGAVTDRTLGFRELSGADTTAPLVANDANPQDIPGAGTDAITSTAQTPSAANAWISGWSSGGTIDHAAGTGFTRDAGVGSPAGQTIAAEHLIQGAAASVAATFTEESTTVQVVTFMMAFKPAGAGVSNTDRQTVVGAGTLAGVAPTRVVGVIATPQTP